MANLAAALKEEIRRLARKEIKTETGSTKQASAQYRRDIAKLRRMVQEQDKTIRYLVAQEKKRVGEPEAVKESDNGVRFSSRSVRAQRARTGLSAADYGRLIGVSGLTVYHWEHGKSRPRNAQLARLVAVRGIGKREAMAKLQLLGEKEERRAARKALKKVRRKPR